TERSKADPWMSTPETGIAAPVGGTVRTARSSTIAEKAGSLLVTFAHEAVWSPPRMCTGQERDERVPGEDTKTACSARSGTV
nr:hypothetical protein [Tanacetum cinerariifolium]